MDASPTVDIQLSSSSSSLLEVIWKTALVDLQSGTPFIALSFEQLFELGDDDFAILKSRFEAFVNAPVSIYESQGVIIMALNQLSPGATGDEDVLGPAKANDQPEQHLPENKTAPNSQKVKSSAKKIAAKRVDGVPRPPNAFILYRKHHHPEIKEKYPGIHNNEISKIVGKMWAEEHEKVKAEFKDAANEVKRKHHERYPGYSYKPRSKKMIARRRNYKSRNPENDPKDPFGTQAWNSTIPNPLPAPINMPEGKMTLDFVPGQTSMAQAIATQHNIAVRTADEDFFLGHLGLDRDGLNDLASFMPNVVSNDPKLNYHSRPNDESTSLEKQLRLGNIGTELKTANDEFRSEMYRVQADETLSNEDQFIGRSSENYSRMDEVGFEPISFDEFLANTTGFDDFDDLMDFSACF